MKKTIAIISILLSYSGFGQEKASRGPTTWAETLKNALTFNSKPKAKDAELLAQKELTKAAKNSFAPTIGLNLNLLNGSYDNSSSSTTLYGVKSQSNSASRSVMNSASVNMQWMLFQCGIQAYTLKSAQLSEAIMAEQFNSTKFFITNTKGMVVASAFSAYSLLIQVKDNLDIFGPVNDYLRALKPIADLHPDSKASLANTAAQFNTLENSFNQSKVSAIDSFKHWVTIPPSPEMVNLQQALDELKIPASYKDAFAIAKRLSPDIKQASLQIKLAEYRIKIAQAALCPRISLNAGWGYNVLDNSSLDPGSDLRTQSRNHGPNAGISVNIPLLDLQARDMVNYQRKNLIAQKLNQQAELDDSEFNLMQTYKEISDQLLNQKTQEELVQNLKQNIATTLSDISQGLNLPDPGTSGAVTSYVSAKLNIINSYLNARIMLNNYLYMNLRNKFSVLQTMGTLFGEGGNSKR